MMHRLKTVSNIRSFRMAMPVERLFCLIPKILDRCVTIRIKKEQLMCWEDNKKLGAHSLEIFGNIFYLPCYLDHEISERSYNWKKKKTTGFVSCQFNILIVRSVVHGAYMSLLVYIYDFRASIREVVSDFIIYKKII